MPVFAAGGGQRLADFFRFFHGPDLRTSAFLNAIEKIARAYMELGIFP